MPIDKEDEIQRYHFRPLILTDLSKEVDAAASLVPEVNFFGFSMYALTSATQHL